MIVTYIISIQGNRLSETNHHIYSQVIRWKLESDTSGTREWSLCGGHRSVEVALEQPRGIGHAVVALAQHVAGVQAFEQSALRGAVHLVELGHHLPHGPHACRPVASGHAQHESGTDEGAAGALHVAHAHAERRCGTHHHVLVDARRGGVGAGDCLRAVVLAAEFALGGKAGSLFHRRHLSRPLMNSDTFWRVFTLIHVWWPTTYSDRPW